MSASSVYRDTFMLDGAMEQLSEDQKHRVKCAIAEIEESVDAYGIEGKLALVMACAKYAREAGYEYR
jgi:hypothetical protein